MPMPGSPPGICAPPACGSPWARAPTLTSDGSPYFWRTFRHDRPSLMPARDISAAEAAVVMAQNAAAIIRIAILGFTDTKPPRFPLPYTQEASTTDAESPS